MGNAQEKPPDSRGPDRTTATAGGAMENRSRTKVIPNGNDEGTLASRCLAADGSYLDAPAGGLPPHLARIKNEGNRLFKHGQFGDALEKYSQAIDGCSQAGQLTDNANCFWYLMFRFLHIHTQNGTSGSL